MHANDDSLKWILELTDSTGRLARWSWRLSKLDFDVIHRVSVKNHAADSFSRSQTTGVDGKPLENDLPFLNIDAISDKPSILLINANNNKFISFYAQDEKSISTHSKVEELIAKQA